ncbi:MAG TPA: tRNA (guanosine(46)-N7)-methyltransferase TrmB [Candidatus Ventricola intestinavium]|nr:tRNA (guanosine(46)-N7)-methyltransferase TrmB [Candidatus Ventricola intestinavium]
MHMRTKKWARPELEACPYFTDEAERFRGTWRAQFEKDQPLYLELGCGKGVSTAVMVADHPSINYVAIDITCNVLGDTRRNIAAAFGGTPVRNVIIARYDIACIEKVFAPEDRVERIYIHFCNPWTKRPKYAKRRLTHPRQLMQYREFLVDGGEIWFKTDDTALFTDSLSYFQACGFALHYLTNDLHASGFEPNYISEHEKKFTALGVPIKFAVFRKMPGPIQIDPVRFVMPGAFARLRQAQGGGEKMQPQEEAAPCLPSSSTPWPEEETMPG